MKDLLTEKFVVIMAAITIILTTMILAWTVSDYNHSKVQCVEKSSNPEVCTHLFTAKRP